jgi:hypothetical protein
LVRVGVTGRSAVLKVSLAVLGTLARNPDGTTTVSHPVGESLNRAGLVTTGETELVALTVDGNVLDVTGLQLLHGGLNVLHATIGTRLRGRDVGVQTGTVPVPGDGLGVEGDLSPKLLGDTVEQETGHPEVIAHLNALAGTDLVLPLGGHDLGVDAGDVDAGVHAGLVVRLDDVTAVDLAGADTAVVRALRTGVTALGPAVRPAVGAQKRILLLETEPEVVLGVGLHQLGGLVTVVELVGGPIRIPGLAQDDDVVPLAEGIREDGDGANVDIGVVARRLAGGGTVEVPLGELIDGLDRLEEGLSPSSQLGLFVCCSAGGLSEGSDRGSGPVEISNCTNPTVIGSGIRVVTPGEGETETRGMDVVQVEVKA